MSKKPTSKPEAQKKDEFPAFDDFFTQFVDKRKKYWTQKLDEIAQLEKSTDLKPDQKEKVNNKGQTLEKIKYFDDIKAMYFEAAAKKGKTPAGLESSQQEGKVEDIVNALAAGKLLSSGKIPVAEEDNETAGDLAEVFNIISSPALVSDRALAKKKLGAVLEKKNLAKTVKGVFDVHATLPAETPQTHILVKTTPHAHGHAHTHPHAHGPAHGHAYEHQHAHGQEQHAHAHGHEQHAHAQGQAQANEEKPKETKKDNYKKPMLFHHSSEDEHEEHHEQQHQGHGHGHGHGHKHGHHKAHNEHKQEAHKENADNIWLVPLPETEKPVEEEFVRLDKHRSNRGPRRPHGPYSGRYQGERRPPREGEAQEGGKGLEDRARTEGQVQGQGQAPAQDGRPDQDRRGGYKGKNYDPNYRKNQSGRQQGERYTERREGGQEQGKAPAQAKDGEGQKTVQSAKPATTEIKQ